MSELEVLLEIREYIFVIGVGIGLIAFGVGFIMAKVRRK